MKNSFLIAEELRLTARLQVLLHCPEYFILFDPLSRSFASDNEIEEAKKRLIEARYPKFYKEVIEE